MGVASRQASSCRDQEFGAPPGQDRAEFTDPTEGCLEELAGGVFVGRQREMGALKAGLKMPFPVDY